MRTSKAWNEVNEIIIEYKNGKTVKQIADEKGYNKNTLQTIFRKLDIEMRKGGNKKGYIPWNKNKEYPAIRGKNHFNWKGGITPLNQKIRHCLKYKIWIRQIFKRDNWTCQKCGQRGGNLEADHYPIKFSDILKKNNVTSYEESQKCNELWNIDNGRTLCLKCHNRTKQVRSRFKKVV